jgi:phosphatidylserine/phosphatidylglycerophosphate/cardiolipin synthase-like enzyme
MVKGLEELRQRGLLTAEVARKVAQAGQRVKLPDHEVPWNEMLDRYQANGKLTPTEISQLNDFTEAAAVTRRTLERELREKERPTPAKTEKLQNLDSYLELVNPLRQVYLESTQKVALKAALGAGFAPLATMAAYLAWNPAPESHIKEVASHIQQLRDGTSPLLHQGNKVEPVPQEKLWQTKLRLLEEATALAKAGNPPEIDVQYFEMTSSSFMKRLAEAAAAGCPVRINIDPSRPRQASSAEISVDDSPRKLRALLQMLAVPGADVAISVYPVADELGNVSQLMHRKLLRVGEKVLFGGMNANEGSGENFDTGYLMEGPAARQLVSGFQEDLKTSEGASATQIYGEKLMASFEEGQVSLTLHGLATTLDALNGPSPAGTRIPSKPSRELLEKLAEKADIRLSSLVYVDDLDHALRYNSTKPLELKGPGKKLLLSLVERTLKATWEKDNLARLQKLSLPQGEAKGEVTVAVASRPAEREAVILEAIASAEKFIYVPTFVITKAVARALVARRDEVAAQGKHIDVRVVADSGLYGHGGTPNEDGYLVLEDAGIPVQWALLTRVQGDHDRKIHAKQILTDKMELVGSTNLSNKGIRENWELSGLVYFDPNKAGSMEARHEGVERFQHLWDYESIQLDTRAAASKQDLDKLGTEEARRKSIRQFLSMISRYEQQTSRWIEVQIQDDPQLQAKADQLQAQGMAYGYARLLACVEKHGHLDFYAKMQSLPQYAKLQQFARGEGPARDAENSP